MSNESQLEALLEIINTSARQAINEYKKGDNQVPTIHSKSLHPIDFTNDTVTLKKTIRLLEGACQQLCASLAPPQHTFHNLAMTFEWACVRVVLRAKVADALEKYPDGLHVNELAKLVNLEEGKLARVLRLLATKGCFTEVTQNNNRISLVALSSCYVGNFSRLVIEAPTRGAAVLYESMTEPEYAKSYEPDKAPIIYALRKEGFEGDFFEWVKHDTDRLQNFHLAMIGVGQVMGSLSILHHYPWNEVKTVCDVGASVGTFSQPLAKMYPHLKIVNQDLPHVLAQAKDVWNKDAPGILENNQVEFVPLNFLEARPVLGQDIYYLRNIIHDWPDFEATVILKNVKSAMAPHSRLLIHEYVMTPASLDPNAELFGRDIAPEPLLPNFGNGKNRIYQLDLAMWFLQNGRERTLEDSIALGIDAGLMLEKVYDLGESSVLEFKMSA